MAIIHTNIQNTAAFQVALNAVEAAGATLEAAVLQGDTAFSEFDNGVLNIQSQTAIQVTGFISGGGTFVVDGQNLSSSFVTVNHLRYVDNSPSATIDIYGNVTGSLTYGVSGTINQVLYDSALVDFALIGSASIQNLENSIFTATSLSIHVFGGNDVQVSFNGNVTYANGAISGTLTSASITANGSYVTATGLANVSAPLLDSGNAVAILGAYLNGNDTIFGEGINQTLEGFAGNDTLLGNTGADVLDGGTGADAMGGGAGNDTYVVDNAGDAVTELSNEGADTVQTAIQVSGNYVLGANIENLILTGSANLNGAGNGLSNVVTGNSGNNVLDGGDGNDNLIGNGGDDAFLGREGADNYDGGSGIDTAYFINPVAGSGVRIADMLATQDQTRDAAGDTYAGIERMWSLDANVNDSFRGTAGDDVIVTGGGDDDLVGRGGADVLDGGDGFDTVWYESIGGTGLVVDWLLPAASTGEAHNDILVAIERIYGAGMNDEFRGGNGNEHLAGGGGDDILDGRLGDDQLDGGAGNDIFIGGLGRDVCIGQGGNDRFIITSGPESTEANPDIIVGFETGIDKIDLTLARTGVSDSYSFTSTSEGSYLKVDLGGNGSIDLMVDVRGIILAADLLW